MSIYSNNRTGCNELDLIAANESYTCNDFGRILYESQLNDMAFFEAILTCDFNEIKGLQEGTILQSEVKAMNEASFKAIKDKLIERLKVFWSKIQGVFKSAIDKISAYALGDGKAFANEFDKAVEKYIGDISKWSGSVDVTLINNNNNVFDHVDIDILTQIWNQQNDVKSSDIISKLLDGKTVKEFPNYAFEVAKTTVNINESNIIRYKNIVKYSKIHIDTVHYYEKSTKDDINEVINRIKNIDIDDTEINRLNKIVGAFETAIAVKSRTEIAAIKYNIRAIRKALITALGTMKTDAKNESLYIDDIDLVFVD